MKIATWNIERLKHKASLDLITLACEQANADILVLTETDERVKPQYKYCLQTPKLIGLEQTYYQPTENRVSIFTNYECVKRHPTYDEYTALCIELKTERGNLLVYGTIIGIYGNRHRSFEEDLAKQLADIERLSFGNQNLCVVGDFNCSFADNYYYTKSGRTAMTAAFAKNQLALLTRNTSECIDHIAISEKFLTGDTIQIECSNFVQLLRTA
ncbi:MAG: endonuclease/exonuclease/phosphatase family protein [Oscillospiraceae bacterium]|jgi:endonuclease/exonuclease/phosphatase family metal-dependent hydrolase|nr:endonuclease/exonuclease/phosphatase family protein [Oscillospiraceae bacterium]